MTIYTFPKCCIIINSYSVPLFEEQFKGLMRDKNHNSSKFENDVTQFIKYFGEEHTFRNKKLTNRCT